MTNDPARIGALLAAAREAQRVADFAAVEKTARELAAYAATAGDVVTEGHAYAYLGGALVARNDGRAARAAFETSRALMEDARDETGIVRALSGLAVVAMDIDLDLDQARSYLDAALPLARHLDDSRVLGQVLGNLAEVQRYEAEYSQAIRSAREALAIMEEIQDLPRAAWQLINIAHCHYLERDRKLAIRTMRSAYDHLSRASYDARIVAWYFDVWFVIATGYEQWKTAALLLGFGKHVRDENSLVRLQLLLPWISASTERMASALGYRDIDDLVHEGGLLTMEEADALTRRPPFEEEPDS